MPLNFTQRTWLEFRNGSRLEITGTYLSSGTTPPNSTWALVPLPFVTGPRHTKAFGSFKPPCVGKDNRTGSTDPRPAQVRKTPSWPRSWANSSLPDSCVLT